MTTSLADEPSAWPPRLCSVPPAYYTDAGDEAVELAAHAGLQLDDWQAAALRASLGETADRRWSAFEVAWIVSRQNGKGALLEARELAGLFLFGERLLIHSAHEFKTAQEAFRRIASLIENTDDLRKRTLRMPKANGEEGVELKNGSRLRFMARSSGSGRGFSADTLLLDEAYNLNGAHMAALLPTMSASPNPQVIYTSSAGMATSEQLHAIRERGLRGDSPTLAYFDWGAPDDVASDDRAAWAAANPAYGIRISEEFVARESAAMPDAEFRRERLGIWDALESSAHVIPFDEWAACADRDSEARGRVAFALEVSEDRSWACIAAAGKRSDGKHHVAIVDYRRGTAWVVQRLAELTKKWRPFGVVVDPGSPAGAFIPQLEDAKVKVLPVTTREVGQACGALVDAVLNRSVYHRDEAALNVALANARKRNVGDVWVWERRKSADISPLVAVTLALRGHMAADDGSRYASFVVDLNDY